jgi:hypothetical protein
MPPEKPQKFWVDSNDRQNPRPFDERETLLDEDYQWCLLDLTVRQTYGGQVVAAHERRIWGAGKDHEAAWRAARKLPGCPPEDLLVFVAVPDRGTEFLPSATEQW